MNFGYVFYWYLKNAHCRLILYHQLYNSIDGGKFYVLLGLARLTDEGG